MTATPSARVEALLARMTLDEKLAQLGCVWSTSLVDDNGFSESRARRHLEHGIGEITRIGASTGLRPRERAEFTNAIQRFVVEQTRLGIPTIVHEESTAGLCARDATQFPQAIGLASTWDPDLLEQVGEVIRRQMVATGARHTLAPVLDVARDPRWGRTEETYGESPYLTARLGVAYVRGVQGPFGQTGSVAATGKHFLGYGFSEGGMNHAPVHLGPRELREVAAEPFRAAIAEAGLATVMNAYNSVDGLACGASKAILDDLLRGELGFTGPVVADYFTTGLLISHHRIADKPEMAAQRALEAGLDMELPHRECYGAPLKALVERGEVAESLVDRSVRRALQLKADLGLFDEPYVDEGAVADAYGRADDRALARTAAQRSLVLLTNDGILPLDPHRYRRVAVLGPAADDPRLLQGDYSYPAHTEMLYLRGDGTDAGILPQGGSAFGAGPYFPESVTPLAGLRAALGSDVEVVHHRGCDVVDDDTRDIAVAVAIAQAADVAIVFVGGRSGLLAHDTSGEFRDATHLGLPGVQHTLVDAVLSTGTPTIVVIVSGRVHSLGPTTDRAAATVYAWCPGEEGGNAIADVLLGVSAPSGRLPISLPRTVGQVPIHHDHRAGGGRSQMLGDYTDSPASPLFPFGHGLTYSTFEYGPVDVESTGSTVAPFTVSIPIANAGGRDGTEVVQLYLRDLVARVARPDRQLAGFARVDVAAGASRTVHFTVDPTVLAYYDEVMRLVVEPGTVQVMVGASAGDIRAECTLTLGGDERLVEPNERVPTTVTITEA